MYGERAKPLNVKNMKELLVNESKGDQEKFNKLWDMLAGMKKAGFIGDNAWCRLVCEAGAWYIYGDQVIDGDSGKVVYEYGEAVKVGAYVA